MRGKDCACKRETARFFTALTAQDGTVRDANIEQMDDAFNRCEKCSEEHFAWEEEYCESLTSEL